MSVRRAAQVTLGGALALGLTLAGCEGDLTEVLLVVDADACAPELGMVTITVDATPAGGSLADPVTFDPAGGLPRSLALVHREGALGPVEVTVHATLAGGASIDRLARFTFIEGQTKVLRIVLQRACAGMSCTGGTTCIDGTCSAPFVAPEDFGSYPAPDSGTTCAPPPDAGGDAGEADGGRPDAFIGIDGGPMEECSIPGTFDCNGVEADGCESSLHDNMNCGSCRVPCMRPRAIVSCETGVCMLQACESGARDCNGLADDGCESDLRDNTNCGGCGIPCALPHAVSSCGSGACVVVSCEAGYDNCDGRSENGCETDTRITSSHCGRCGAACATAPAHGASECVDGRCTIDCDPAWADCNTMAADGCEASLSDPASCGDCGSPCSGGMPFCSGNTTTGFACVNMCPGGLTLCGESCVATDTNPLHCGRCDNPCPDAAHGSGVCSAGSCRIQCDPGWGDCNTMMSDGCEIQLETIADCGACGRACTRAHASATCAGGTCRIDVCSAGFGDCNTTDLDGCEQPLDAVTDCGACDVTCTRAQATASCAGGVCRIGSCLTSYANCDSIDSNGCEVDTRTDDAHCGGCGRRCDMVSCAGGVCDVACVPGALDCNMMGGDGCEVDSLTDPSNCGECMMTCPTAPNATVECDTGTCSFECNPGFGNCTMAAGCETNLLTSTMHCGACGNSCGSGVHSTGVMCTPTGCQITGCDAGYADCDTVPSNGCESRLAVDAMNCGMCGRACFGMERCTSGMCRAM